MGVFTAVLGAPANSQTQSYIDQQKATFYNSISDETRSRIDEFNVALATINPLVTREAVERAKAMAGTILDPTVIEALQSTYALKTSNEHTAILTLAHPTIDTMHRLGQIDAYGLDHHPLRNALLQRRIESGFAGLDGTKNYIVRNVVDNYSGELVADYNEMSSYQKRTVQKNQQQALFTIFEENDDFSSAFSGGF